MHRSDYRLSTVVEGQGNHSGSYWVHHRRDLFDRCRRHVLQHGLEHSAATPFKKEPHPITPRLDEQLCPREGCYNCFLSLEVNTKPPSPPVSHPSPPSTLTHRRSSISHSIFHSLCIPSHCTTFHFIRLTLPSPQITWVITSHGPCTSSVSLPPPCTHFIHTHLLAPNESVLRSPLHYLITQLHSLCLPL